MPVDPIARALFVSLGEITPLNVTENGTYEESGKVYSPVTVNVENSFSPADEGKVVSNGALVSQSSQNIDSNGVYDTTLINSIDVNVSGGGGDNKLALVVGDGVGGVTTDYTITSADLAGVTVIREYAFFKSTHLTSIAIPEGVTKIEGNAFRYCSHLTSVSLPNSLTQTGNNTFADCSKLETVNFPSNLTSISQSAFNNTALTEVKLDYVISLHSYCFAYCTKLVKVDLPASVTTIQSAFYEDTKLQTVICRATTPPTIESQTFYKVPNDCAIYVPDNSVNDYKVAQYWSARASYIFPLSQYNP